MSSKSTKKHYDMLAQLGCILCRNLGYYDTPAEIHHIRKAGMRRNDAPVIPLCPAHHRGRYGLHGLGRRGFVAHYGITEDDLLQQVTLMLEPMQTGVFPACR